MIYIIGSGHIGSSLAEYFSDRGYDLQVLGRNTWPDRFREEDTIINCAASGYRKKRYGVVGTVEDNFLLPVKLDGKRNGANMIHISSWNEECACNNPYAWSKALATEYFTTDKDKYSAHICMTSSVWGGKFESPEKFMGTFLRACSRDEPYLITHPFRRRDFVHIDTFSYAIEQLTKTRDYNKRYFATGRLTSFYSVYAMLKQIAGREFPKVQFADDLTANYDWRPISPMFEDTFKEDLEREWRILCAS